jgi:iron complex outermembrane receptor protein
MKHSSLKQLGSAVSVLALAFPAVAWAQGGGAKADDDIVVMAQRVNATHVENGGTAGVLGNKAAEDLPFNLRSFDETLILNQQPRSLGEVLENDPTVRTTYGFGNAAESFIIRGFELAGDDVGLNGLYGIAPRQLVAPELFGSVQVLNGASAFLNGAAPGGSGLGGSVNLLLKRAGGDPLTRVTAGFTSDSHFGGSFDVSRKFGELGVRVNANWQDGELAIDGEDRRTQVLGAGFSWASGPVRISLDLAYQKVRVDRLRPKVTIYTATVPRVPKGSANYAQDHTYTELRDVFGVFDIQYDFAENATLWAKAGARDGSEDGIYGGFNLFDAVTGAGSGNALYVPRTDNNEAAEVGARVKLGSAVTQEFVIGANINWQVNRNAFDFLYGLGFAGFPTNLYDTPQVPLPSSTLVGGDLSDPYPVGRNKLWSAFASDTIGFWDDRLLVTLGLRLQTLRVKSFGYYDGGLLSQDYKDDAVTPVVGIVVKPVEGVSVYANRIEALQQGPTAGFGAVNFGEVFAPYISTQYEIGAKASIGPMFASVAFYQIKKPYGYIDNTTLVFNVNGVQRNRGMEVTLNGEIAPGLRLISGFAINDAKLVDTGSAATDGNKVKGVPAWTANANVEWDTPMSGLTVTGRMTYTGKQWVDAANTLRLPDWAVFNLGARYVVAAGETPITLRLNVDNITDKRYWASAYDVFSAALLQGQPRTFKASISADF